MAVEKPLSAVVKEGYLLPYRSWAERIAVHAFVADIPTNASHPSWDELVALEGSFDLWSELPSLICWGEKDWCFTPAFREEWQARLPKAKTYRFATAGHYLFEDAGDDLRNKIEEFLQRETS